MSARFFKGLAVVAAALAVAACGEKSQEAKTVKGADAKAWEGSSNAAFKEGDWTPGDRAAWEQQLKARNQNQNEYTRVQ